MEAILLKSAEKVHILEFKHAENFVPPFSNNWAQLMISDPGEEMLRQFWHWKVLSVCLETMKLKRSQGTNFHTIENFKRTLEQKLISGIRLTLQIKNPIRPTDTNCSMLRMLTVGDGWKKALSFRRGRWFECLFYILFRDGDTVFKGQGSAKCVPQSPEGCRHQLVVRNERPVVVVGFQIHWTLRRTAQGFGWNVDPEICREFLFLCKKFKIKLTPGRQ